MVKHMGLHDRYCFHVLLWKMESNCRYTVVLYQRQMERLKKSRPVITKLDTVTILLLCQMEINGKVRAMVSEWL